jgi:hypothetical protein
MGLHGLLQVAVGAASLIPGKILRFTIYPKSPSRLLKKATARKEAGICGGVGFAHTPTYADSSPSGLAFSACS